MCTHHNIYIHGSIYSEVSLYQQSVQVSSWPVLLHCLGQTAVTLPPVLYTQPTQLLEVFCLRVGKPTEPGNSAQLQHDDHHILIIIII